MKLRLLTSAYNDLTEGRDFYERQGEGLGGYFLDSLFSDIDSLVFYAGIHRKAFGFHRLLSKRFPYAVYYQVETGSVVVVYRVLDCRQNPRKTGPPCGRFKNNLLSPEQPKLHRLLQFSPVA